jgi:UDP:flavonoid glycosyltransferase YjiC (YdhE family)
VAEVVVVTWDGGGNLPPALGIAGELVRRGHRVRFLGHERQRSSVEGAGFGFEAYRHARPWSAIEPLPTAKAIVPVFAMFTDGGPGVDLRELIGRQPADLLVIDVLSLGALKAADGLSVPVVALMHSYYQFFANRWARGPIGLLGTVRGRSPQRLWARAARVVVAASRDLDPASDPLPGNVTHVGVVQAPVRPGPKTEPPRILVSLSTVFYPGQAETLQAVLDALAGPDGSKRIDADVVVTTGDTIDPLSLRAGPNVNVQRYLPHDEVMPSMSLVISHGGHSTVMRALCHDVPVLVLPMHPMLDQQMIGESIAAKGAGLVLPRDTKPVDIAAAIGRLLYDPRYRTAAADLGARLRSQPGQERAADIIEDLLLYANPHALSDAS